MSQFKKGVHQSSFGPGSSGSSFSCSSSGFDPSSGSDTMVATTLDGSGALFDLEAWSSSSQGCASLPKSTDGWC